MPSPRSCRRWIRALAAEGFTLVERKQPSLLVDGCVLITGEVDRVTDYEHLAGPPTKHQLALMIWVAVFPTPSPSSTSFSATGWAR